jgi:hypothetical protein
MRTIDGTFHVNDAGQIVKSTSGEVLQPDEPLFLLRARDLLAIPTLTFYLHACTDNHCTDYQTEGVRVAIAKFTNFRNENSARMKQPGITLGKAVEPSAVSAPEDKADES